MGDVVERDWKLFKTRLPIWQERFLSKLVREYAEILSNEEARASERFWALDERLKEDKRCPGVIVHDMRRSTMHTEIARLVLDGVITMEDLDGFTEDVTDYVEHCLKWRDMT